MLNEISPTVQKLTKPYVDGNQFSSTNDVLLFAMHIMTELDARHHAELTASLDAAFDDTRKGKGISLRNQEEVKSFFDGIAASSRAKMTDNKK